MIILLLALLFSLGILFSVILPYFNRPYIIAVVHKDQSDTVSLHPTRLRAALSIAWEDFWEDRSPPMNLQLKHYTYEGDGPLQGEIVEQLEEDRVIAFIGDFTSRTTQELASIAHTMEVPHLSPIATDEMITIEYPWTFSPRTRLKHETQTIIEIIETQLQHQQIILLVTDTVGLMNRYDDFKEQALTRGLEIVLDIKIDGEREDFSTILEKIISLPSDVPMVSFILSRQTIHLYQQMKVQDLSHPKISSANVMSQELLHYLGEASEGVYSALVSFHLLAEEDEKSRDFSRDYITSLGTGSVDNTALSIYESLWVLLDVIEEVGIEAEKIKERLLTYRGRPLTGYISFDSSGLLKENNHLIILIENGRMVTP